MYLWISNPPLTEFRKITVIKEKTWVRFTQEDEHRGAASNTFCWRGFIRVTHKGIYPANKKEINATRIHSQVYLDVNNFSW